VECKIDWQFCPRTLFHRTESRFRQIPKDDAGLRIDRQETLVIEACEIQAEAVEIVRRKYGAANFGVRCIAKRVAKCQPERERRQLVVVCNESPSPGQL